MKQIRLVDFGPPARLARQGGRELVVFLPAARTNPLGSEPYYVRLGWAERLPGFDCLYIADPFERETDALGLAGSWFVDAEGQSALPALAAAISAHAETGGYERVTIYGSSMGGYGALVLGYLMPGVRVISECPQIYLDRYPASQAILERYAGGTHPANIRTLHDYVCGTSTTSTMHILVSMHDRSHLGAHVASLMTATRGAPRDLALEVTVFALPGYARGHVALRFEDAAPHILAPPRSAHPLRVEPPTVYL